MSEPSEHQKRISAAMKMHWTKRKYKNVPQIVDGIRFASKREAHRYCELKLLEKAGEISNLEIQPAFKFAIDGRPVLIKSGGTPNGRQARYVADFAYWDGAKRVVEDVKGMRTPEYKLKKALVEAMFPAVRIVEI